MHLGLLDAKQTLDINGWSLEKALGGLEPIRAYGIYSEHAFWLFVNVRREEEWFPISKTDDWSVNLTVYHQKLDDNSLKLLYHHCS